MYFRESFVLEVLMSSRRRSLDTDVLRMVLLGWPFAMRFCFGGRVFLGKTSFRELNAGLVGVIS